MTFEFSVFVGTDFFQQARLDIGDAFQLPTTASARLTVSDDDAFLSGDLGRNGRSDDRNGQTAEVSSLDGSESESVGRVSIERVYTVVDENGNEYTLIEIDVESRGGPDNNDYYAFSGPQPPAGASLSVAGIGQAAVSEIAVADLAADSSPSIIRIEAEDLDLSGYRVESNGAASGDEVVRVRSNVGTAETQFVGVDGTYDISVDYIDENDGQGTIELLIDGQVVGSFTLDADDGGNGVSNSSISTHVFEGVEVAEGQTVTFRGTRDRGEFARIDSVAFEREPIVIDEGTIRIEAEDLVLSGYRTEGNDAASGDEVIRVRSTVGTAETEFSGADGSYNIYVDYIDENDGQGTIELLVDGVVIDSFTLDADDGGNGVSNSTISTHVFEGVDLAEGQTVTFRGTRDSGEFARIDAVTFAPEPAPIEGPIRIEAEALDLTGYEVDDNDAASGGNVIKLSSDIGTAETEFPGVAGTYDISVDYIDENDGQGTIEVLVDGVVVGSVTLDADDGGNGVSNSTISTQVFEGIELTEGQTVTFRGTRDDGEFARIDAVTFDPVADEPITNTAPIVTGTIDLGTSNEDTQITITAAQLLANAADADGDALSVANLTATSGTLTDIGDGTFAFTPDANDDSAVTFNFDVSDGTDSIATSATLDLTPVNDDPTVAAALIASAVEDDQIFTLDLLDGASDVDTGAVLGVANVDALVDGLTLDGTTLTIDPSAEAFQSLAVGVSTDLAVSYDVIDEDGGSIEQTATVTVTGANDIPTFEVSDEIFLGDDPTPQATIESLFFRDGANLVAVEDGSAVTLDLSPFGFDVDDDDDRASLTYSVADQAFADNVSFDGAEFIFDPGADFQDLTESERRILDIEVIAADRHGAEATDTVTVVVWGLDEPPENLITGTDQDDTLIGDELENVILGLDGNDTLIGNESDDIIDGGDGIDTVDYSAELGTTGILVDLRSTNATDTFGDQDSLRGIENVIATDNGDNIATGTSDNFIDAGGQADRVAYQVDGSDDVINGGSEEGPSTTGDILNIVNGTVTRQTLSGLGLGTSIGSDPRRFTLETAPTELIDPSASDSLATNFTDIIVRVDDLDASTIDDGSVVFDEFERVSFSLSRAGDSVELIGDVSNTALGESGGVSVSGREGSDTVDAATFSNDIIFNGGGSNDLFRPGAGRDTFNAGDGIDTVDYAHATGSLIIDLTGIGVTETLRNADATAAGLGLDTLRDVENIIGGSADDTITGSAEDNILEGGGGDDTLNGAGGTDRLSGGAGDDTFVFTDVADETTVSDFVNDAGESDVLDISAFDIFDISQLQESITQDGDDALIQLDSDTSIVLESVDAADLDSTDFLFSDDIDLVEFF